MTAITDEQRREVAAALRKCHVADAPAKGKGEFDEQNAEFVMSLAEVLAHVDRGRLHYAPYEFDRRPLMDVLADLIDRPTRRNLAEPRGMTPVSTDEWFECSECHCKARQNAVGMAIRHCPNCGAEVVR